MEYGGLLAVYRRLIRQDAEHSRAILYAAVNEAVAIVGNLNATIALLTATGDAAFVLAGMQEVVANALTTLQNVQRDE